MDKEQEDLINKLFDFAFNNVENKKKMLDLGIVDKVLAKKIEENTDLDLENYLISIDNFGIRHAIEKHGSPKTEEPRGQIAITKEDFSKLLEIIQQADKISLEGKTAIGKDVILFEKQLEVLYAVAEEVRSVTSTKKGKQNRLVFQSFWKRK